MASVAPVRNGSSEIPKAESQPESSDAILTEKTELEPEGEPEPESAAAESSQPADSSPAVTEAASVPPEKRWPGWPGDCVFRIMVPVLKVGSIIGRKGDIIKKMCEETRARIRILDAPVGVPDRTVLISAKEETESQFSPAMDAVIRVFKRVNGLESESDGTAADASSVAFCSIRLLVASTQAISLIGKQGSLIKSMQEGTGASIRVLSVDEMPKSTANSDERVVDMQGEASKVLKALEAVLGHLRKFLVDHSVLPLFEKSYSTGVTQERQVEKWAEKNPLGASQPGIGGDYSFSLKRDSLLLDREPQRESQLASSGLPLYGRDTGLSSIRSPAVGRASGPIVTQVSQTMQIPLSYAEDIIGVGGTNIAYIRRTSGAILTVQESRGLPEEITVEIKGTAAQVQTAQQLIQECVSGHREPVPSSYGVMDTSLRHSYSHLGSSSSFAGQSYGGGYGSYGFGGYSSSYRM